jgi:hypothetical protein
MRLCKNCGKPLAEAKRSHAVFCNITCKKQEEHRRRSMEAGYKEKSNLRAKIWREQNKGRAKASVEKWHKDNPERVSLIKGRHRYRKRDATPSWLTESQIEDMAKLHAICRKLEALMPAKYHVDHIVPLQGKDVCGLNVPWNLQILEAGSNIRKSNKMLGEHFDYTRLRVRRPA